MGTFPYTSLKERKVVVSQLMANVDSKLRGKDDPENDYVNNIEI